MGGSRGAFAQDVGPWLPWLQDPRKPLGRGTSFEAPQLLPLGGAGLSLPQNSRKFYFPYRCFFFWGARVFGPANVKHLLAVSLARGNLIRPEGFEDRKELEKKRLEKEQQQEATRQEEEIKRQEAEARRKELAQAQALFESLPEEEKEAYLKQAARMLPGFMQSTSFFVENQAHLLILEEKLGGNHLQRQTGNEDGGAKGRAGSG